MLLSRWILVLRRLGLVLSAYLLLRIIFLVYNRGALTEATAGQIALAFLQGLRFDVAALAPINCLFVLLAFLPRAPRPSPLYEKILKGVFFALNVPFLIANIIDLEFFQFTGRRLTAESAEMAGDAAVKWSWLVTYYWPLVLLGLVMIVALFFLYPRARVTNDGVRPAKLWLWLLNLIFIVPLTIITFRGGLQFRWLSPAQAMAGSPGALSQLALNSSFTLLKSYRKVTLPRRHDFKDQQEVLAYLRPRVEGKKLIPDQPCRDNVIILILESFSAEYWGVGNGGSRYTPFLDSLATQSLFFTQHYANGRRSIEAPAALLGGLPSLMTESLLESIYQNNTLLGLGTILAGHGYTTSFFHGAMNGTMRFDTFMRMAGIQNYFGLNEYANRATDFDGTWGIYDEPYLQYMANELTKQKQPFAAVAFTLSSHSPYPIPPKYRGRFKKGTLEVHESIGYTDFALQQFFATARQQPWYSNTLFIITGDHTQKLETPEYLTPLGHYRVPLLMFHPQHTFPDVNTNRVTEHVDVLPSVLDYLGIEPDRRMLFGKSVFRENEGRAFLHMNGHYWLVRGDRAFEFVPSGGSHLFAPDKDPQCKSPLGNEPARWSEMEKESKALVQYFNNGMLDNKLYDTAKPISSEIAK